MSDSEHHEHRPPAARGGAGRRSQAGVNGTPRPPAPAPQRASRWGLCPDCRRTFAVATLMLAASYVLATGVAGARAATFSTGGLLFAGMVWVAGALVFDKVGGRQ